MFIHYRGTPMAVLAMIFNLFAALGFTVTTVDSGLLYVQLACGAMIGSLIVTAWLVAYSSHTRSVQALG
ncbi:hypothetical protein QO239_09920 [Cupriavidus taiwanensis]|uniref:hypothetical protein n=1 Tax=Cupriavidus taiwanensis TaxID=164546 RepID=UPI00254094C1|nr:hypothetical protein [Cupriavidus taiwanensis]MDK3022907.1 hypothetical protein [Cupriavidus taiwanensis]